MGLFNKSRNTESEAPVEQIKKKKKGELSKVLNESVWESACEDFKSNSQFIVTDGGETKYVALLFDTDQVGGLTGREARKDESKGSIIEAIRTGRIKTYLRPEMLLDDAILIIPTKDTIENMDEFTLFYDVNYVICLVDGSGLIRTLTVNGTDDENDPELTVTFDRVKELISTGGDVHTLFHVDASTAFNSGSAGNADDDVEDLPDDEPDSFKIPKITAPTPAISDFPAEPEGFALDDVEDLEEDPDEPDDLNDVPGVAPQNSVPPVSMPQDDYDASQASDEDNIPAGFDSSDEGGYDQFTNVTADVVTEFVTRKFYSDDLGLSISTEPFDAQFMQGNTYIPFDEHRGDGWLESYLSQLSKDANTRMQRLHTQNLFKLRERFMRLMQGQCETIAKKLDTSDYDTIFGKMCFAINDNKEKNIENLSNIVSERRDLLERQWNEELEAFVQQEAEAARVSYISRNKSTFENKCLSIEVDEKAAIEADYRNAMTRINTDRRTEASKLLDLAVGETLRELSDVYTKMLEDEQAEYARIQQEFVKFIDDNRKDEVARTEAIAEENRQAQRAEAVRKEYIDKMKAMTAEFDMKKTMLQADIERMNQQHQSEINNINDVWSEKLETQKSHADELESKVGNLLESYSEMDEKNRKEYADRIARLTEENKAQAEQIDRILGMSKKFNYLLVILIAVILIAGLGVGFFAGTFASSKSSSSAQNASSSYTQQVDGTSGNTSSIFINE